MSDKLTLVDHFGGSMTKGADAQERFLPHGRFKVEAFDLDGKLLWEDTIENTIMTEGKNLALDTFLAGSAYTVTGPYMGMISSTSFTAIAAGDTGAQINGTNGWKEAGLGTAPTYTCNRKTFVWSAASPWANSLSASLPF